MKKLAKGIMYAGGIAGAFVAGMHALAAMLVFYHEFADKETDLVIDNSKFKVSCIGVKMKKAKPGYYPAIFEIKEKR